MRHFLLILMIALLPLRGWTGDTMALQMALEASATTSTAQSSPKKTTLDAIELIADNASYTRATDVFDHEIVVVSTSGDCADHTTTEKSHEAEEPHCGACSACQTCHTVALPYAAVQPGMAFNVPAPLLAAAVQFASAEAAFGQKPPIS